MLHPPLTPRLFERMIKNALSSVYIFSAELEEPGFIMSSGDFGSMMAAKSIIIGYTLNGIMKTVTVEQSPRLGFTVKADGSAVQIVTINVPMKSEGVWLRFVIQGKNIDYISWA